MENESPKLIVCGLDPGSGTSSPTGFALFNADTRDILNLSAIASLHKAHGKRLYDLHEHTATLLMAVDPISYTLAVYVESFYIKGRGNQILQQVIGALKAAVPTYAELEDVANTTVKRLVAGTGSAGKDQVAFGVYQWFQGNDGSAEQIVNLIEQKNWDLTDALAIGIAGVMQREDASGQ